MNKQNDMISKSKLLAWLEKQFREYPEEKMGDYGEGQHSFDKVATAVEYGVFDPDPIPLPTLKPGDKVRHKDNKMKYLGIGNVKQIAASGMRALVDWPNYDKKQALYTPLPAYYRLDKLELVEVPEDVR